MHDPEPESDMHLEPVGIPSEAGVRDSGHLVYLYLSCVVSGPSSRSLGVYR
jgi:hypothetical protein